MERLIYFVIFLLLAAAGLVIVRPDIALREKARSSGERKEKLRSFRKQGRTSQHLNNLLEKRRSLMASSGIPRTMLLGFTVLCIVGGFFAGRVVYNSIFISVCTAVMASFVPILILSLRQNKAVSARLERLASSMMILSNSYLMTDDFITSVEQNIDLLEYPEPFRDFLTYVTRITPFGTLYSMASSEATDTAANWSRLRFLRSGTSAANRIGHGMVSAIAWNGALALSPGARMSAGTLTMDLFLCMHGVRME